MGRTAGPADVAAVTATLASAFHEDPLWGRWSFPQESDRRAALAQLMRFWVEGALPHGWVRMTERAEAVAVWLPPGAPEMSEEQAARFDEFVAEALSPPPGELAELFEHFEQHHPAQPEHYYLSLWGTHRDSAGRGLGSALIEQCLAEIDRDHAPAYLESTNPVNVPRYEALGFARTGEFFAPGGGPTISTMWREAR